MTDINQALNPSATQAQPLTVTQAISRYVKQPTGYSAVFGVTDTEYKVSEINGFLKGLSEPEKLLFAEQACRAMGWTLAPTEPPKA